MTTKNLKSLSPEHKLMARQVALYNAKPKDLVEYTGYTSIWISRIMNDPLFVREVDRLTQKLEEHEFAQVKKAKSILYENLEQLVESQIAIAYDDEVSPSVRSNAIDKLMQYGLRRKDLEQSDAGGSGYLAVQLSDTARELDNDPDVNPAANKKIIKLFEKKAVNDG